jgi:hypothetical protein
MLEGIDTAVRLAKRVDAQGVVFWDPEGQEFPHAISYVGDPRLIETLSPEMTGVIDSVFERLRQAGLRVGLTIRPQSVLAGATLPAACRPGAVFLDMGRTAGERRFQCNAGGGWVPGNYIYQGEVADHVSELTEKIEYAKRRWGATLFYVDSNSRKSVVYPAEVFRAAHEKHRDVLLIPEHEEDKYYAWTAPYHDWRVNSPGTPETVRRLYPNAFSVTSAPPPAKAGDGEVLRRVIASGDVVMFPVWYENPTLQALEELRRSR